MTTRPTDKEATDLLVALIALYGWEKRVEDDDGDMVRQVYPESRVAKAWVRIACRSGQWQASASRTTAGKMTKVWVRAL